MLSVFWEVVFRGAGILPAILQGSVGGRENRRPL
jgi:hypothetical protein